MICSCFSFLLLFAACTATPVPAFNNVPTMSQPFPNSNFMLNIQELADLAMDYPKLTSQSLLQLYQQSTDIINGTDADRVLYSLDPMHPVNDTKPIMVMAVYNPSSPSGADLLEQFKIYYVNVSETTPYTMLKKDIKQIVEQKKHNTWATIRNFFKNQANAVVGAFMLPYKVSAHAMHQVSSEHAQYVASGTTFGYALARPILMKSIALPSSIAQQVVNMTVGYVNAVQATEHYNKQVADQTIDTAANNVAAVAESTSQVVVQYVVRPVGAFAGYHLNQAGKSLSSLGSRVDGAGHQVTGLGQQLGQGALVAVDSGVTAIQWSLDNSTVLPGEQHNGAEAMVAST